MKKFTLTMILLLGSVYLFSQSPRLVLQEEFTSSTCGPCATVNPKLKGWLTSYPDIYTAIFYHVNWPSPGNDPMYAHNPAENSARVAFYSVSYVPYGVIDGNYWTGNPSSLQIGTIQTRAGMPSPFQLQVQQVTPATNDTIYLTTLVKATEAISAPMTLHNVVIEKNIHFSSPPGTNGEKDFPNVMKKMLPTKDGTTLPATYDVGDYSIIETVWPYANVYDVTQVAAISFIQNKTNKEVYQAANSTTDELTMPYDNDLEALEYSNISVTNCSGTINPVVRIRNNGNNTVTSFTVNYQVNSGAVQTYTWSGSIAKLQKTLIQLPAVTFSPEENNVLKIYTTSPNSVTDEYPKNDTMNIAIAGAPVTYQKAMVIVRTDANPQEVSWDVKDSGGNIIAVSDPYTQANHTYRDTVYVTDAGCYTYTIYDAGGDGVCCNNGVGVFQVLNNSGTIMHQGNSFGSRDFFEFKMDYAQAVENHEKEALKISPNPFTTSATISFSLDTPGNVTLNLYDLTGKLVRSVQAGYFNSGNNEFDIQKNGLPTGIYVLQLQSGTEVHTRRIAVQ